MQYNGYIKREGHPQKPERDLLMKRNTIENMIAYLNGSDTDTAALKAELEAELAKLTEKARANADLYAAATPVVKAVMSATPMTAKEIYAACENELPEGFTANKVQYLLLHQLADVVKKHDNGKNANSYSL